MPTLQSLARRVDTAGARSPGSQTRGTRAAGTYTTYFALEFVPSAATTLSGVPSFSVTFDAGDIPNGTVLYVAYLTGNNGSPTWTTVAGPTTYTGGAFTFTGATTAQPLNSGQRYGLVVYAIGSGSPVGAPSASPSPGATSTPTSTPTTTPTPTPTPGAATNPASIGAYVLGVDANNAPVLRAIAPGAADYGRTIALPAGFSPTAIDTDAAGNAYVASFATVSGGKTGTRIDRYPSGGTSSSASIPDGSGLVAAAPDGTVYFPSNGTLKYAAPNSTAVLAPLGASGTANYTALRTDGNGNVYAVQSVNNTTSLVQYTPQLASVTRTIALPVGSGGAARRIGIDGTGTVYVAISSQSAQVRNSIAVIAVGSTTPTVVSLTSGNAADFGFDASNNVYVALAQTGSSDGVSVYTPNLASLTRSILKPASDGGQPSGIRVDAKGAIYLITGFGYSSGALYIYAPGASTAQVTTMTGITLPTGLALGF
ncbi:MAG TPA: hypothetical protein VGU66_22605 [Candidatus Elarobacter sp.]|nr:hypothetical protein [Candidatus Elarobacter sp.]